MPAATADNDDGGVLAMLSSKISWLALLLQSTRMMNLESMLGSMLHGG